MSTASYTPLPSGEATQSPAGARPDPYKNSPQFTVRAAAVGILIGTLLCFTNMYFGLQTGWISMMSLQSSLLGFAIFKAAKPWLKSPFTPAENIVLQSIAVATGTMPLAAGFVGIIPALQMMTEKDNPPQGPIHLTAMELVQWCLAIAFFGVFIAVPLRRQVIIKEKLPFPSGTATAQMIGVLHNVPLTVQEKKSTAGGVWDEDRDDAELGQGKRNRAVKSDIRQRRRPTAEETAAVEATLGDEDATVRLTEDSSSIRNYSSTSSSPVLGAIPLQKQPHLSTAATATAASATTTAREQQSGEGDEDDEQGRVMLGGEDGEFSLDKTFLQEDNWRINMTALGLSFTASGAYTVLTYFYPVLGAVPVFDWLSGMTIAFGPTWQIFFSPSLSYMGQGFIMGFPTTASMLLGCVVGWGILSPLATLQKWVTGPVSSSTDGARGWILWISLGVMIAESVISLLGVVALSLVAHYRYRLRVARHSERRALLQTSTAVLDADAVQGEARLLQDDEDDDDEDAPIDQLVPLKVWVCGLILSSALCLLLIGIVFKDHHMPMYATLLALVLGCLLSVLGVRALGSTDLNPVSGIGKVSQFVFAGVVPGGIVANLIAGGIAEAGAQQAGDLMQDLKTGHLMGASPKAQFWGQLIGSVASVFISTGVYKLYSSAYTLPGPEFAVPTAKVWLDLARLVNGHSLPDHVIPFIWAFAALFAGLTLLTTVYSDVASLKATTGGHVPARPWWMTYLPSGIAFAIGMYNLPNFTLARFIGGVGSLWWDWHCKTYGHLPSAKYAKLGRVFMIIIASGFVLGEGTLSIVNLVLKTYGVPSASCVGCYVGMCTCN